MIAAGRIRKAALPLLLLVLAAASPLLQAADSRASAPLHPIVALARAQPPGALREQIDTASAFARNLPAGAALACLRTPEAGLVFMRLSKGPDAPRGKEEVEAQRAVLVLLAHPEAVAANRAALAGIVGPEGLRALDGAARRFNRSAPLKAMLKELKAELKPAKSPEELEARIKGIFENGRNHTGIGVAAAEDAWETASFAPRPLLGPRKHDARAVRVAVVASRKLSRSEASAMARKAVDPLVHQGLTLYRESVADKVMAGVIENFMYGLAGSISLEAADRRFKEAWQRPAEFGVKVEPWLGALRRTSRWGFFQGLYLQSARDWLARCFQGVLANGSAFDRNMRGLKFVSRNSTSAVRRGMDVAEARELAGK